ncbi:hypothetical protein JOD82_003062 [Paenibacillus sp. 1182]|nr:hypothetical protein [Paenibacillus sp. 1182]
MKSFAEEKMTLLNYNDLSIQKSRPYLSGRLFYLISIILIKKQDNWIYL